MFDCCMWYTWLYVYICVETFTHSALTHLHVALFTCHSLLYLENNKARQGLGKEDNNKKKQLHHLFFRRPVHIDWWWMDQPLCSFPEGPCLKWQPLFLLCSRASAKWWQLETCPASHYPGVHVYVCVSVSGMVVSQWKLVITVIKTL